MSALRPTRKEQRQMNHWRHDPKMVSLANPNHTLTAKERKDWERNITQYQLIENFETI